jgi:ABC-2 type transport system ATP-binding protein
MTAIDKSFADVHALDRLSVEVERGEMFGLVGPDGAGKTTAIRILCGIMRADAGTATVLGFDVVREVREIRRRIGYLSQRFTLYGDLSLDENIEFFARIHGVADFHKRREELLEFTRLAEFRSRLADRLSGGMKQKLALVCTLIHTPELILLDEPTTGVDPVTRRDFWKLIAEVMAGGTTILVTTPYMDEAERCSRVAFLSNGRILACDRPAELRTLLNRTVIEIVCEPVRGALAIARSDERLRALFPEVQMLGERIDLFYSGDDLPGAIESVRSIFEGAGIAVIDIQSKEPSLENVFLDLIEKDMTPATTAGGSDE